MSHWGDTCSQVVQSASCSQPRTHRHGRDGKWYPYGEELRGRTKRFSITMTEQEHADLMAVAAAAETSAAHWIRMAVHEARQTMDSTD